MPRVKELKPQYMEKDIGSRIVGMMFRSKVSQTALAKELGVTPGGMHHKLMNNVFTYKDLIIIFRMVGATEEEVLELMMI